MCVTQNRGFVSQEGTRHAPPLQRHRTLVQHIQDFHYANLWFCVTGEGWLAPLTCDKKMFCVGSLGRGASPPPPCPCPFHCSVTQQTRLLCHAEDPFFLFTQPPCLLRHAADMSAVSHSKHVCSVTQQTCLLCHTADISAASHSRHVCCITRQTVLLCHTADTHAVSHSRHVCCVTLQTCLMCHTADMSCCVTQQTRLLCRAVESPDTVITFVGPFANSQA